MASALLQAALGYAARGYLVLPCLRGEKIPCTQHGLRDASGDQNTIRDWWSKWPEANLAIRTDALLVLDLDPGAGDWPGGEGRASIKALRPALARTPRGGWHIWFRRPTGVGWRPSTSRLAPSVDTRTGLGSYVLVPPAVTAHGQYRWIRPVGAPDALPIPPDWLCQSLDDLVGRRPSVANDSHGTDGPLLFEGGRNAGLASLAGKLRRAGLCQAEIEAALLSANALRCKPPLPDKEVLTIARSVSRYPTGPELRGILNSGHRREMAHVIRVVGDDMEPRQFATYSAKAIACIGKLPPTLEDRAISIRLERRRPKEEIARLDKNARANLQELARRIFTATDCDELKEALGTQASDMPALGSDRARDNWEPLVIVADVAGADWPARARKAAQILSLETESEDIAERFISDVATVFRDGETELSAKEIAERIIESEDSPWPTYSHGKPISPEQVGRRLKSFGITASKTKRVNLYSRTAILEVAAKYSPPPQNLLPLLPPTHENPVFSQGLGVEVIPPPLPPPEQQQPPPGGGMEAVEVSDRVEVVEVGGSKRQNEEENLRHVSADSTVTYVTGGSSGSMGGGKSERKTRVPTVTPPCGGWGQ